MPTGAATVLFDFDGTLVRGDCAAAWLRIQLRRDPLRRLAAGLSFPFLAPGFAWWRSAWLPASFYTWRIGQSMRVSGRRTPRGRGQNRTGWAEGVEGV